MIKYRIVAKDVDEFEVQYLGYTNVWTKERWFGMVQEEYKEEIWLDCYTMKTIGSQSYMNTVEFKTEKECEAYIAERIQRDEEQEEKDRKKEEFVKANPPREVPPYKYFDL